MELSFDVIIVGAGPAGIFTAYELTNKSPQTKVLLVDKGKNIYERNCPILEKKIDKCPENKNGIQGCQNGCSITGGFGGAGAYSDGKFNITSEFGGWLGEYLDDDEVNALILDVDAINLEHGAPKTITDPNTVPVQEIATKGAKHGLKLLKANVRHLGTERNLDILKSIYETLKNKITMAFGTTVEDILLRDDTVGGVRTRHKGTVYYVYANHVVLAPGRDGASWLEQLCKTHGIPLSNNQVDIGVRVETSNEIMETINTHLYEGKFLYQTSLGTQVRTFCANPGGHVVIENHSGTMLANGHAFSDVDKKSANTNFALLVSHNFTEPFKRPSDFAHRLSSLANMLSDGSLIIQTYGDLKKGRRTTEKRLNESFVKPTLKEARPGDLGLVLPYNTMISIIEMIEALESVTPGIASLHTLLYGVEAKFYSARPRLSPSLESDVKGLFFGGDGAGITRGLAQAGACGIKIARSILEKDVKQ